MIRPGIRRLFRLALRRPDLTADGVDEEIRLHLELRVEQLQRAAGLSPGAARAEAERRFGAVDALHHAANRREKSMRLREWVDELGQDVRYALRGLRREPLVSTFVIATLALGIGANAAMFGIVDRLLLRGPEHVVDADRVVRVYSTETTTQFGAYTTSSLGYVSYINMRDATHGFDGVAAYQIHGESTIGRGDAAQRVTIGFVTADLFPMLGVKPEIGRFFTMAEDRIKDPEHVAVLGYGLWQRLYGGDRGVVGRTIVEAGEPFTIVGVAPRGFTGPQLARVDVWIPMSVNSQGMGPDWSRTWNAQWMEVVARLKPGVTPDRANADATAAHRRRYNGTDSATATAAITVLPLTFNRSGKESIEVSVARWLVGVAVAVLLIACANVVNLLLARSVRRRREVAVRLTLGAARGRLMRLLLTESVLLAAAGGLAGLVVAYGTGQLVRGVLLPDVEWTSSPVDGHVLALSAIVALATGLIVGLAPALQATRPDVTADLKSGVREGGSHRAGLRDVLTVAQAALSVVLLVGAGLFVRSLWNVRSLDLGIQPDRVIVVSVWWPGRATLSTRAARDGEAVRQNAFNRVAAARLGQLPDIESAAISVGLPFRQSAAIPLRVPGRDSVPKLKGGGPFVSAVTSDYFRTVGTRVLRGRAFTDADHAGTEPVAIVSRLMADLLWPGRDAIGECFAIGEDSTNKACARIVGVAADAHRFQLREPPAMQYYIPLGQEQGFGGAAILVRPRGDAAAAIAEVRNATRSLDPSIEYVDAEVLQQRVDPQVRPWRLGASIFGLFGILALVVAAIGLYSVMAYLVAQRTHEIGVRIALGARSGDIVGLVLRNGVGMAAFGVAIGVGLALFAGRYVKTLLFDISPRDPLVIGGVAAALLAVAVLASWLPAVRASGVDPMEALRAE